MSGEISAKAQAFIEANILSPVVAGYAHGQGGQGGTYRLKNGKTFKLSKADCEAVGYPRWDFGQ